CGPDNGPLRVLPGSHRAGLLRASEIDAWRQRVAELSCIVLRGGLLVMRPLLLHASSPAKSPAHRRVIHVEYAATHLFGGLEWFEQRELRSSISSLGNNAEVVREEVGPQRHVLSGPLTVSLEHRVCPRIRV